MSLWTPAYQRHLWLAQAVVNLKPTLGRTGLPLPERVLVQAGPTILVDGWPALGQCVPSTARSERLPVITISGELTDRATVLATLVHELIHAADDCRSAHGAWFAAWAQRVGLQGSLPSTHAGPGLAAQLETIGRHLGPYPPAAIGFSLTASGLVAA